MFPVRNSSNSPSLLGSTVAGSSPMTLLSNRYRVLNLLSDGGFGEAFLAEDIHMPSNRKCVIKQLKPVNDTPEIRKLVQDRFQREAAILEKLGDTHRQIPQLYANFTEAGRFYLVEEWIQGITLTDKVNREGPLSESTVQKILAQLLPVIAHIHEQGIVHRDIKPDNIILRYSDQLPVLIDFGAVKETMSTLLKHGQGSSQSIVVGTPGYMSSEQISGRPIYASDLYSLGMTAIFLLTGQPPHMFGTDPLTGALDWHQYAPNVSEGFANVLDCATHFSARSRFASAQAMQSALGMTTASASRTAQSFQRVSVSSQQNNPQLTASATHSSLGHGKKVAVGGGILGLGVLIVALTLSTGFIEATYSGLFRGNQNPSESSSELPIESRVDEDSPSQPSVAIAPEPISVDVETPPSPIAIAPEPIPVDVEVPEPIERVSPTDFMRDYYTKINNDKIDEAWQFLTPEFQISSSNTYSEYFDWWNRVEQVNVEDVALIEQSAENAIVEVRTFYIIEGNYREERPQQFTLVWNASTGAWQINDRIKL